MSKHARNVDCIKGFLEQSNKNKRRFNRVNLNWLNDKKDQRTNKYSDNKYNLQK